jgi:hypothetical protein
MAQSGEPVTGEQTQRDTERQRKTSARRTNLPFIFAPCVNSGT